jgi:hypothetical protein
VIITKQKELKNPPDNSSSKEGGFEVSFKILFANSDHKEKNSCTDFFFSFSEWEEFKKCLVIDEK